MYRILIVSFLSVSLIYAEDINDPFEDINRITFKFNESIDDNFLKPVALTYSKAPKPIKKGISNFFDNLEEIETSVNQILQGKPKLAINDFSRFIINSTIGLGGFLDIATKIGLTRHEEEFDQTLALWGVPSGPYIMLPGLGPSTLRDTLARPFSSFLSVTFHMTESDVNLALKGMDALETRERLLEIESLIYGDRYNFVRDSYVQYMNYEINDGVDVEDEFIDDMDDLLIEQ
ncbi:VacJ family lipoprotein [Gammaproteobacteria bacterium]|nr:VacJ family lipoprotein [Gammaproteobacteria bacterium]MDC0466688.1 VacJ family lipoprotein [Gammaproteobacteria bacterium]MDC1008205.1 VacJ family lipoprotein [Gammaproteobacteria bacterium]